MLCSGAGLASGQVQERKLLDRLLKPDMTLQNNMQDKQFAAADATLTRQAPVKAFHISKKRFEKAFWNTRQVSGKEFETKDAQGVGREATVSTRGRMEKLETPYSTTAYSSVHDSSDGQRAVPVSDFAGNRTFEVQGKSQKFLNTPDRPMTIDQVRELLNKNK